MKYQCLQGEKCFCTHEPAFEAGTGVENVYYAMHTLEHVDALN